MLLVLSDIFRSILLPRPTHHALRLGPLLGGLLVPVWRAATVRIRSAVVRQTVRASLAPLLLVISLLAWVATLVLGYGLMLHALADRIEPRPDLRDALYLAGSAFLTLGLEQARATGLARAVVLGAALSGLAVVTVVASFLLIVQEALHRREVLVFSVETVSGRPPTGVSILESYARGGLGDQLAGLFRDWESWAADVLQSHRSNPVLAYFRSADHDAEWLAVFGAVLDAATLVLATVPANEVRAGHAAARLLLPIGYRTVDDLAGLFRLGAGAPTRDLSLAEFRAVRARLEQAGYRLDPDEAAAHARLRDLRGGYEAALAALADHLAIELPTRLTADTQPAAEKIIEKTGPAQE